MKTETVKPNNKIDHGECEHGESEHSESEHNETVNAHTKLIVHQCKTKNQTDDNQTFPENMDEQKNTEIDDNQTFPENMNEQKNTEIDKLLKTIDDSDKKWNSSKWLTGC